MFFVFKALFRIIQFVWMNLYRNSSHSNN